MRVAYDARPLLGDMTGIGCYTNCLLEYIISTGTPLNLYLFSNKATGTLRDRITGMVKTASSAWSYNSNLWYQLKLPLMLRKEKVDLFHGTMAVLPVLSGIPSVLTIHDLALELLPETMYWKNWLPLKLFMKASVRKADRIIAVSENTKKDIIKFYGIVPEKVKVIYLGVDKNFSPQKKENDDIVLRRYRLKPGYILNVGTIEPRKNIMRLLEAYRLIAAELSRVPQLVITGGKGWLSEDINKHIDSLGLKAKVILTGYVSADDLPSLYRGAALFVYPSLYEGFGLPPLEAMASGIPVVSSNTSSIPEVVGKAGLLVDPCRTDEIARAIVLTLEDNGLRDRMKNEGLKRSSQFSWESTAQKTIALYEEALRGTR